MNRDSLRHSLLFVPLALATLGATPAELETELPIHIAADASAPPVTEQNLLASERFWPYQVSLLRAWQPAGRGEPLAPGIAGVLVRVEEDGEARIDFGRDGLYTVPVGLTDLVANAERIRRGELAKDVSNFLLDVGPRLVDPSTETPRPYGLRPASEHDRFICVFADPDAPGFEDVAAALAPLRTRTRVLTILFPRGSHDDAAVRERLRALGWPVPFILGYLSEGYSRALLPEGTEPPAVLLVSREGRLLFGRRFDASLAADLEAELAAGLASRSR